MWSRIQEYGRLSLNIKSRTVITAVRIGVRLVCLENIPYKLFPLCNFFSTIHTMRSTFPIYIVFVWMPSLAANATVANQKEIIESCLRVHIPFSHICCCSSSLFCSMFARNRDGRRRQRSIATPLPETETLLRPRL